MAGRNDGDIKRIDARIAAASALLQDKIDSLTAEVALLKPRGWKKAVRLLRELGPLAASVGLFVALLGVTTGALYQSFAHVKEETQFRTHTEDRLGRIEADLKSLLAVNTIRQAAELKPHELSLELPKVRESIQTAQETGTKLPDQALGEIQTRLLNVNEASPGYWPLAFALISYRSIIITGMLSPPGPLSVFKDVRFQGAQQSKVGGVAVVLGGLIEGVDFVNSWVEFDLSAPLVLKNTHFDHCVLVFRGMQVESPSPLYQRIARQILASTVADVKIPSAG
jgi:hypothetical protein